MPRITAPAMDLTGAGMDSVLGKASEVMDSMKKVTEARAAGELFKGLGIGSSQNSIPDGIGDLIGGVGSMMKASTETQANALNMAMGAIQSQVQGSGGEDSMMKTLQMAILAKALGQDSGQKDDSTKEVLLMMMQQQQSFFQMLIQDKDKRLEEAKSNSGGITDQIMLPFMMETLTKNLEKSSTPSNPLEELTKHLGTLRQVQEQIPGLLGGGGNPNEPSPGQLRMKAMEYEHLHRVQQNRLEAEKEISRREAPMRWGQLLEQAAQHGAGILGNLVGQGFAPSPEQQAQAQARAQAAMGEE